MSKKPTVPHQSRLW